MSKLSKQAKQSVELKPSRIRRDPVPVDVPKGPVSNAAFDPSEKETWTVVIGILLFAIAITVIIFGVSDYIGR